MAIDFAEVLLLEQPGRSGPALHHLRIAPPQDVRRAARHTALRTLDQWLSQGICTAKVAASAAEGEHLAGQHFVCVEVVPGEGSEWIVGDSDNGL
jgi:hypothetical protein